MSEQLFAYRARVGSSWFVRSWARAVLTAAGAMLLSTSAAWSAAAGDISGVWWAQEYSPILELQGGGEIPYNAKGKAAYAKNVAGLKNGSVVDEARTVCVPDGVPRILGNPYPLEIVHTPIQTFIFYELNHAIRPIGMNEKQLSQDDLDIAQSYSGHSVGHWEGDTLVVETAGFNERTFLDATGAPHSDQANTVERIRKINGGKQLEDVITITDPDYLLRPIAARYVYDSRPDVRLQEYTCGEQHRDISKVPGVAEARRAKGL